MTLSLNAHLILLLLCFLLSLFHGQPQTSVQGSPATEYGSVLYAKKCAACHDAATTGRVPSRLTLHVMSRERILAAMEGGVMLVQARGLSEEEREALATFLTGLSPSAQNKPSNP